MFGVCICVSGRGGFQRRREERKEKCATRVNEQASHLEGGPRRARCKRVTAVGKIALCTTRSVETRFSHGEGDRSIEPISSSDPRRSLGHHDGTFLQQFPSRRRGPPGATPGSARVKAMRIWIVGKFEIEVSHSRFTCLTFLLPFSVSLLYPHSVSSDTRHVQTFSKARVGRWPSHLTRGNAVSK